MTLQETYETCEYQGCQCKTCGNDRGGECRADTGNCVQAAEQGRCPVRGCPMYKIRE